MTRKDAVKTFIASSSKWTDYWSMQLAWAGYVDGLCRDGDITPRQQATWGNPTTPEKFNRWNNKNYK